MGRWSQVLVVSMSEISAVSVTVPATTANLGPGFDCLGAALTLYNHLSLRRLTPGEVATGQEILIQIQGMGAEQLPSDRTNLVYQAIAHYYQYRGQTPPPLALEILLGYPLARGLGSSATAIVGGLVAANALADSPLERSELLPLAIALEGHPDNVVPALLGGCYLAVSGPDSAPWTLCEIPWAETIVPIVAIPNFALSTKTARGVLPDRCPYADAIFNTAHLGLLLQGLTRGRGDWLQIALQDRLHQPYRQSLIPGYAAVHAAALAAGAYGLVISGAGPTLLALSDRQRANTVAQSLQSAWEGQGIRSEVKVLQLDFQGARVSHNSRAIAHPQNTAQP